MPPLTAKPDPTELIILAVLADGSQYGYAITKMVAARSADGIRLSPGILYPTLSTLERLGLIRAEWETITSARSARAAEADPTDDSAAARGRRRKWYSLTAKGRKRLNQRVRAHREHQALIDLFIAGLGGVGGTAGVGAREGGDR